MKEVRGESLGSLHDRVLRSAVWTTVHCTVLQEALILGKLTNMHAGRAAGVLQKGFRRAAGGPDGRNAAISETDDLTGNPLQI